MCIILILLLLQSSVHVSNYNLISLIHKLTTGEDYTASINAATKPPVQSIISQGSYAGCDYVNQHEAKKEDGLCEELKGPLFTGELLNLKSLSALRFLAFCNVICACSGHPYL